MDNIAIQKVTLGTFDILVDLITALASYEKLPVPDSQAIDRLKDDSLGEQPKFEAFIAYLDNKPVGYTIVFMTYSSFLALSSMYIDDMFVLEEFRHQGIGQALFDFTKALAKERNCGRIELTTLDWNKNAVAFYEKNGGKHLKDWRFYRFDLT